MHIDKVSLEIKTLATARPMSSDGNTARASNGQESVRVNDRAQTSGLSRLTAREIALVRRPDPPRQDRIDRFRYLAKAPLPPLSDAVLDTIMDGMTGRDVNRSLT